MRIYCCDRCGGEIIISDDYIECSECGTPYVDVEGLSFVEE